VRCGQEQICSGGQEVGSLFSRRRGEMTLFHCLLIHLRYLKAVTHVGKKTEAGQTSKKKKLTLAHV
jgi:hypothetical protein